LGSEWRYLTGSGGCQAADPPTKAKRARKFACQ
jgi:hypothetical protein